MFGALWISALILCGSAVHTEQQQQLLPHGRQQLYELTNTVAVEHLRSGGGANKGSSYTFKTLLKVNSVWHSTNEQLVEVFFLESSVSTSRGPSRSTTTQWITKIPDRPFYISFIDGGRPNKVIAHTSRDQSLLNLERGIASLLQLQYSNGPVQEVDVSGQCTAFYAVKSSTRVEKTKTDCSHWDLRVYYRGEKPLGVSQHSQEFVYFDLTADGSLHRVESVESHRLSLEAKPDTGSLVKSQLILEHKTGGDDSEVAHLNYVTLDEAINSLLEWYRVFDIEGDVDGVLSEIKGTTLKDEIKKHANQLKDDQIGKETLAFTYAQLLPLARITKQSEFVGILHENKELQGQLVDLLGAVQTVDAHKAINEVFQYKEHASLLEKYLQSLTVGVHPDREIIKDLFARLKDVQHPIADSNLRDSVLQTVAALTRQAGFDSNDPLLTEIRSFLLENLKHGCKTDTEECKLIILRALQNLQDPTTIPVLIDQAVESEPKLSVLALQALKSFPIVNYNDGHRQIFEQIFYQTKRKHDSSARTLALDILLQLKPTIEQLGALVDYLTETSDTHFEVKTYVLQKLKMMAEKCPRFRVLLQACFANRPHINNYHGLAQKGLSTVLTRELSRSPSFNETLLSIQEIYKGVLKRGSVELLLSAGREEKSTFKLALYTSGLTSFVGGDGNDDDGSDNEVDDSPATAGMEITVQDAALRPIVFFTSQSELMGHAWSGTASELTPAYQATTLSQDHEQYIVLSSGATIHTRVLGARSVDLNGKVNFSIWNRNAEMEINQNSGAAVLGTTVVGFTYAKIANYYSLRSEPILSLQSNIDFYSEIKLCMQLQRPETILRHSIDQIVTLSASHKYENRVRTKYTHRSPGRTLALNQKNNEMCNILMG